MGLLEYRNQLDEIDAEIVRLFEERMSISEKVAEDKIKNGRRVLDREREQQKLAAVASGTSNEFNEKGIKELYQQIMAISRKRQYQMMDEAGALKGNPFIPVEELIHPDTRVVYQGAEGSYSEAAMKQFFG